MLSVAENLSLALIGEPPQHEEHQEVYTVTVRV